MIRADCREAELRSVRLRIVLFVRGNRLHSWRWTRLFQRCFGPLLPHAVAFFMSFRVPPACFFRDFSRAPRVFFFCRCVRAYAELPGDRGVNPLLGRRVHDL